MDLWRREPNGLDLQRCLIIPKTHFVQQERGDGSRLPLAGELFGALLCKVLCLDVGQLLRQDADIPLIALDLDTSDGRYSLFELHL